MPSLRLFRSAAPQAPEPATANLDDGGLLAFASEAPAGDQSAAAPRQPRTVLYLLAALALVQVTPTALWLKARLRPVEPPAVAAAPAATVTPPPAPVAAAAAPCEPVVPAPVSTAGTPAGLARPASLAAGVPGDAPVAPVAPRPMVAGMISVAAPVPMQVYLRGKLVGTTEAETIMLPVGSHDLEFRNDTVGYRTHKPVVVQAGRTSAVRLEAPPASLSVNALPWAEVFLDDQRIGQTPIANVQTTLGSHEIVFRHPELGERRATVLVTTKEPARVSMDLRKK